MPCFVIRFLCFCLDCFLFDLIYCQHEIGEGRSTNKIEIVENKKKTCKWSLPNPSVSGFGTSSPGSIRSFLFSFFFDRKDKCRSDVSASLFLWGVGLCVLLCGAGSVIRGVK
jgi:hypothetical protein